MAQGAAMAIADAAAILRRPQTVNRGGVASASRLFEAERKPPTSRVQLSSRTNTWGNTRIDAGWVYGYDACTAPLEPALEAAD
jgi:6-hydroxynicotinate 3-monooxygenase